MATFSAGMGSENPNSNILKDNSVRIIDSSYNASDVLKAISNDIGKENIMGVVKTGGQWIATLKKSQDVELLQEIGLTIKNDQCVVTGVSKIITTVSFFGVPYYIEDNELTNKLIELGCKVKSNWTRKHYEDYPSIENGIRFVRVELPNKTRSLPYALTFGDIHLRIKHNGQTRVCNRCLSEDHLMRNCPKYSCKVCHAQGHSESRCPNVQCYRCHEYGHKSFLCPENQRDGQQENTQESNQEEGMDVPKHNENEQPRNESNELNETEESNNAKQTERQGNRETETETVNHDMETDNPNIPKPTPHLSGKTSSTDPTGTKRTASSDEEFIKPRKTVRAKDTQRRNDTTPNLSSARTFTPKEKQNST